MQLNKDKLTYKNSQKAMDRIHKLLEFLKQSPEDSFLKHALGLEYIKIGNDTEARKMFESVLEVDPSYIGTYYHLAKLLERIGERTLAIEIYQLGMQKAKEAGDNHALGELRGAFEELTFD